MKFSEMSYKRPDPEKIIAEIKEATEKLKNARSYEEARAVFLETEERSKAVETAANATAAAIAGGVSDAKMDELIKAIDRLTDAVKALAPQK